MKKYRAGCSPCAASISAILKVFTEYILLGCVLFCVTSMNRCVWEGAHLSVPRGWAHSNFLIMPSTPVSAWETEAEILLLL